MNHGIRLLCGLTMASVIWSAPAFAGDQGSLYLNPGLIYFQAPDKPSIGMDDAEIGAGLVVGFPASKHINIEVMAGRANLDYDLAGGSGSDNADLLWMDVLYRPITEGAWQPFVLVGGGRTKLRFDDVRSSEKDTQINAGVGVFRSLTKRLAIRGDVRLNYSPEFNDVQPFAFVGLTAFLGEITGPPVAILDSDGDGVPDPDDKCPNTPPGTKVGPDGCELDSDGDGVLDGADACPGTPPGVKVDERGCPPPPALQETVTIDLNLEFDFDSAQLRPAHHSEIDEVAAFMKQFPGSIAVLEGHTDSRGSDAYNQALSERRAKAVMEHMVNEGGIAADRLSFKGLGESMPIDTNETDEGRQHNRRVSAQISNATN